jgi:hypothetical protein
MKTLELSTPKKHFNLKINLFPIHKPKSLKKNLNIKMTSKKIPSKLTWPIKLNPHLLWLKSNFYLK